MFLYEEYIGEEGVTMRLRRSLGGFHIGEISEIRDVIEFVESYIGAEETKKRMKENLRGFSKLTLSQLKQWETELGIEIFRTKLKKHNLQYLLKLYGKQ